MIFFFGTRLFGKVDSVPGLFHVATRFMHVDYVPLIPSQSWLIFEGAGAGRGVPIPMCGKSVLIAWGRVAAIGAILVAGVMTIMNASHGGADAVLPALTTVLAVGLLVFLYRYKGITHASYERACHLAQLAGFNQRGLEQIRRYFQKSADYSPVHGFPVMPADGSDPLASASEAGDVAAISLPVETSAAASSAHGSSATKPPDRFIYFVNGRDRQTGQEVCVTVHARSPEEARQEAVARQIAVEKVELSRPVG